MRLTMNTLENEFPQKVYDIINSQDEVNCMVLKNATTKYLKNTSKIAITEYLATIFTRTYYYLINNPVYKTINKESSKILKEELKILIFLMKNIKKLEKTDDEDFFTNYMQILECFFNINNIRIAYIKENTNIGRLIPSSYHLMQIEELLKKEEELEIALKLKAN
jgi:hypothetical protein